jgi:hypothetical protein
LIASKIVVFVSTLREVLLYIIRMTTQKIQNISAWHEEISFHGTKKYQDTARKKKFYISH